MGLFQHLWWDLWFCNLLHHTLLWLHLWQKPWLSQGAQSTQYEEINVPRNLHKQAVNVWENIVYGCGHMTHKV